MTAFNAFAFDTKTQESPIYYADEKGQLVAQMELIYDFVEYPANTKLAGFSLKEPEGVVAEYFHLLKASEGSFADFIKLFVPKDAKLQSDQTFRRLKSELSNIKEVSLRFRYDAGGLIFIIYNYSYVDPQKGELPNFPIVLQKTTCGYQMAPSCLLNTISSQLIGMESTNRILPLKAKKATQYQYLYTVPSDVSGDHSDLHPIKVAFNAKKYNFSLNSKVTPPDDIADALRRIVKVYRTAEQKEWLTLFPDDERAQIAQLSYNSEHSLSSEKARFGDETILIAAIDFGPCVAAFYHASNLAPTEIKCLELWKAPDGKYLVTLTNDQNSDVDRFSDNLRNLFHSAAFCSYIYKNFGN